METACGFVLRSSKYIYYSMILAVLMSLTTFLKNEIILMKFSLRQRPGRHVDAMVGRWTLSSKLATGSGYFPSKESHFMCRTDVKHYCFRQCCGVNNIYELIGGQYWRFLA